MVTVDETLERSGEIVLKSGMHWISVLAEQYSVVLCGCHVADEVFEFVPVRKSRIDLVPG